jgi:hypothetical protein
MGASIFSSFFCERGGGGGVIACVDESRGERKSRNTTQRVRFLVAPSPAIFHWYAPRTADVPFIRGRRERVPLPPSSSPHLFLVQADPLDELCVLLVVEDGPAALVVVDLVLRLGEELLELLPASFVVGEDLFPLKMVFFFLENSNKRGTQIRGGAEQSEPRDATHRRRCSGGSPSHRVRARHDGIGR